MKPLRPIARGFACRRACCVSAGLVLLVSASAVVAKDAAVPAAKPTNAPAAEIVIPASVFNATPQAGRNPFFPHSARDGGKAAEAAQVSRFPDDVKLRGISVSPSRRLAIINGVTFAADETGEIKVNGRRITVRVTSVKNASAVVTINGITEELFLRK